MFRPDPQFVCKAQEVLRLRKEVQRGTVVQDWPPGLGRGRYEWLLVHPEDLEDDLEARVVLRVLEAERSVLQSIVMGSVSIELEDEQQQQKPRQLLRSLTGALARLLAGRGPLERPRLLLTTLLLLIAAAAWAGWACCGCCCRPRELGGQTALAVWQEPLEDRLFRDEIVAEVLLEAAARAHRSWFASMLSWLLAW